MNKEKLHIFYDVSIGEIRGNFTDEKGVYISTSAWQDILKSLLENKKFQKKCFSDGLLVEYSDIIVQIDNWHECIIKNQTVKEYIQKVIATQQYNRLKTVKIYNENVLNSRSKSTTTQNEELLPSFLEKAFKERHDNFNVSTMQENSQQSVEHQKKPSLKVKRKNKYPSGIISSVVVGAMVIGALSMPTKSVQKKSDPEFSTYTISTSMPSISKQQINNQELANNDFKVDLNISDFIDSSTKEIIYDTDTSLQYEDRSQTDKAIETRTKYGDLIEKYAKKCGIDPRIVLGIATQESGNHELGLRYGSKGGLMQIEVSYWNGKEITYYDFDDKESYIIKINDNITDVENNILIGCAILQNELKIFNYNIPLAIQSYNEGYSNMSKILDETSAKTGLTKTSIINNDNCFEWLNYTNVVETGDPNYVNNVLSWTGYGYNFYEFVCQKENGDLKVCTTIPITSDIVKTI